MNGIYTHRTAGSAEAFQAAYAASRALRSAALADDREQKKLRKARKRAVMPEGLDEAAQRTWRLKEQLRIEDTMKAVENAKFQNGQVDERLREGYKLHLPRKVYGRWREGVQEKGLRSADLGLPGQMFVASCLKGGALRMSWDKANLGVESRSKLLSLDAPYFEANKTFLSFWRIDLDGVWPSVGEFRDDVDQLVGCKIPFAPHLVAGDELPDGRFSKPHLIIFLPPGESVWNDPEDSRCNMRTVKFFEAVYYGIVDALKPIKADPGAPATTQRGKNPLSPMTTAFTMNEREFMSMSDWAGWVDTSLNRESLVRHAAADNADLDMKTSNQFFTVVQEKAYELLRRWYFDSDLRLRARGEGGIADELHMALEPIAQELAKDCGSAMTDRQISLMVARVSSYAAGSFDPARLEKAGIVRKALLHVVDGLRTVRERQQVAAEYASKEKAEKTLQRIVDAWDCLAVGSSDVSKSELAREAKVSRTTVYARWSDLQAVLKARTTCAVRCIDKRPPVIPAEPNLNSSASQDKAPAETVPQFCETFRAADIRIPTVLVETSRAPEPVSGIVLPRFGDAAVCIRPIPLVAMSEPSDALPWLDDDRDDEALIAEQQAFLAGAFESLPDMDEDDEEWHPGGSGCVTTLH